MALYLNVGDELLSPEEITEKALTNDLERIKARSAEVSLLGLPSGKKTKFTPVGYGKPLSVEIREIYTAELPNDSWYDFKDKKSLIVTTSHKPITQQSAGTRAINLMREEVAPKSYINYVAATETGTPIIYYSPAVVDNSVTLTVEFGFEDFSKQTLNTLSRAFQTAATIPIFATKSMLLLAGGIITKLMADLGKAIFEKGPEFTGTGSINFERAGMRETVAGFGVLFSSDVPRSVTNAYHVNKEGALIHRQTGNAYSENHPYAIISLDGADNKAYENFRQSAASAELLAQFYNIGENRTEPVEELLEGMKYLNDMKFRREAVKIAEEINGFKGEPEDLEKLKEKKEAILANILTDELKP